MFQHGAIKIVIHTKHYTQQEIDNAVTTMLSNASSKAPRYHEKIGEFDAVFKIISDDQHQIRLFGEEYNIFVANTFLPKSEIVKIIESLGNT